MDALQEFGSSYSQSDVTIIPLPVTLGLVHIPRHRLPQLTRPVIKLVLQANPTFLNISCNDTEVSIITEERDVVPFTHIARRDARKLERRRAQEARDVLSGAEPSTRRRPLPKPVEVSSSWSALQIVSHGEQLGDASARIREISSLLSGISILYQSSYTTDFIFVQSRLLPDVLNILQNANYLILNEQPSSMVSSSSVSDPSTRSCSPLQQDLPPDVFLDLGEESRVRSRRGTTSSHASLHSLLLAKSASVQGFSTLESLSLSPSPQKILSPMPDAPTDTPTPGLPASLASSNSPRTERGLLSPCRPNVSILPTDLVVVGLNDKSDHLIEAWSMKLIKLLLFRETMFPFAREGPRTFDDDMEAERGREQRSTSGWVLREREDQQDDASSSSPPASDFTDSDSDSSSVLSFHSAESSPSPSAFTGTRSSDAPLPFFSLTRTAEETSLTSDAKLLATLFPAHEREGMVIGGDVFDRVDGEDPCSHCDDGSTDRVFKCLHVNLEDYGLDRNGLVNRFSDVLHSNNIHHLYCSTFKTANLLVDERDAERAQVLLREC